MSNIKLTFPTKNIGAFVIPVRISDINYGNHIGNDSFISILHEARLQWLKSYNYTELDIEGTGLIMSSLSIDFKAEGFYGDQLVVEIGVGKVSEIRFDLLYIITVIRNDHPIILAIASTTMVSYDYSQKKKIPISDELKSILQSGL